MTIGQRVILVIVSLLILGLLYWRFAEPTPAVPQEVLILIFASLAAGSFSLLLAEHWFTAPSDGLINSLSVLLAMLPAYPSLSALGVWYYIIVGFALLVLLMSVTALSLMSATEEEETPIRRFARWLKDGVSVFGRAKVLYVLVAFSAMLAHLDTQSPIFLWLVAYSLAVIVIDPRRALPRLFRSNEENSLIGDVIGVQSRSTFLAKLRDIRPSIRLYDLVEFRVGDDKNETRKGIVVDNWVLNSQQWIKILSGKDITKLLGRSRISKIVGRNLVYKINSEAANPLLDRFVGTVSEGSNILALSFEYGRRLKISEGTLLEVVIDDESVLYQVTQGTTRVEVLESKNEAGLIVGTAAQVGVWNSDTLAFDRFGWVPEMNTPVYLAPEIEPVAVPNEELLLGHVPSTNYPVLLNKREALNCHTAILGVTGTGKSVFARNLIRNLAGDGSKFICIDFTGEYRVKFADLHPQSLVPAGAAATIFQNIDSIAAQMAEFANKRDVNAIAQWEQEVAQEFRQAIIAYRDSAAQIALFELPDVANTTSILSYTRWFFKVLFELARTDQLGGNQFGVVLEEAHTVVPEWNFVSADDKGAQALLNQIGQIALQGRKYGIGFIVIAQRTANVSKTVLTQCNTIVAFQQFDRTSGEFLSNYMGLTMVEALQNLRPRQAIAVGKAFRSGMPMIFQVPEIHEP